MATTVHDIARELNISAMTVSRVLNGSGSKLVAPKTRDRVLKMAAEMGYRPNRHARALVTGRTNTIALCIDHLNSSIYAQLAHQCHMEIQRAGLQLTFCEMNWHFLPPENYSRYEWAVDGILAIDPPMQQDISRMLDLQGIQQIARVNLGSGEPVAWEGDYVRVDMMDGTRAAVDHLADQGCRRIAYAIPRAVGEAAIGNCAVFQEAVLKRGLLPEYIACNDWSMAEARRGTREYVKTHGAPDGIFTINDEFAIAAFRGLRDAGIRIPEDTLIVGCEGNEFVAYFDPPLSTVAMPISALAQTAWRLLDNRINNANSPVEQVTLPYELLRRESSLRPAS
jgi:DNA-binding LacI/PurR family transcriptional regulator